jgi:HSP20 family protein
MADDMDRLLENFGLGRAFGLGAPAGLWRGVSAEDQSAWLPEVETFRRGDKLVVRADLPGLTKDDVKAEIDNGMLTISGHRSSEREENSDEFYRSERSYGSFYRTIPLPEGIESDNCEATSRTASSRSRCPRQSSKNVARGRSRFGEPPPPAT